MAKENSMSNSDDITFYKEQLEQYREGLRQLRGQDAVFTDGEKRLHHFHQIKEVEAQIRQAKAQLRQLKVEPTSSRIDPPEQFQPFPELIIKQYPYPLALPCLIFNQEQGNITKQFIALDKLISHLIKYLTGIFIGQARRDWPPEYLLPERLEWLATPTLEAWAEALGELSQLYRQSPWREKWCLDGLLDAVTRPRLGQREIVEAIDYLTFQLDKTGLNEPSIVVFLQLLAWYCGQEWEDAAGEYPTDKAQTLMLRLQPALISVLHEIETLRHFPLVYLEWAEINASEARLRPVKFTGEDPVELTPSRTNKPPVTAALQNLPRIKPRRFYVADDTGLPLISLHPIFVLHRWEMYQLKAHRPSNYLEFLSCVRGTSFRPPPEASTYFTSWSQGEVEPGVAEVEEVPPLLGEDEERIQQVEPIPSDVPGEPLPLTWLNLEGRQVLEFALGESLRIGRFWLGVEFLLMGLTRQTGGIFFRLLREIGLYPGEMRGTWRILAGVIESERENWRNRSVGEIGQEALPRLRQVDAAESRTLMTTGEQPGPFITPRMMGVLQDAVKLADGGPGQ
jgi:hypothetical protein